jgi:hypothetical protein
MISSYPFVYVVGMLFLDHHVQWVDRYFWLLVLDSRDPKHKLEVTRLGQVVQNRFQKMNMKKEKQKAKFQNL